MNHADLSAQCRQFVDSRPTVGGSLNPADVFLVEMLGTIFTCFARLESQIGELFMATQADVDALTQQITDQTTAWKTWAANVQTVLANVEAALTAAEQANNISLDAEKAALADAQTTIGALPTVTDPTVSPANPAPSTGA